MITHIFQVFLTVSTLSVVVYAIRTAHADHKEAEARADRAFTVALAYINRRTALGYYDGIDAADMKNDFDNKYMEALSQ